MRDEKFHQAAAFVIHKISAGWFVVLPDETQLGPYLNGEVALEVMVTHALLARNQGLDAHIFVRDNYGGTHRCMIIDEMNDPHRCLNCESSWPTSTPALKCPLWAAISGR